MSNKTLPLISVIIPFCNNEEELLKALDSVLRQTYQNIEIIIINDSTVNITEHVQAKLKNINNLKIFQNERNMGPGFSRNRGIHNSSGTYIAFLDSDDSWTENKIEIQIKFMQEKKIEASHTSYLRLNTETLKKNVVRSGLTNCSLPISTFFCRIATPTVIVKKKIFDDVKFPEDLRYMEDTILWLRIAQKTKFIGFNIVTSVVHVNHNTSAFNKDNLKEGMKRIRNEFFVYNKFFFFLHYIYCYIRGI